MTRDVAPVIAAEVLLRHGVADDVAAMYLARTWRLDESERRAAVSAAHVMLRRRPEPQSRAPLAR